MLVMGPLCKHDTPRDDCPACRLWATDPNYRAAIARRHGKGAPPSGESPPGPPVRPAGGPGTELKRLLAGLGLDARADCGCQDWTDRMDGWGAAGCRENRAAIIDHLRQQAAKVGWAAKIAAGAKAVAAGLILNPLDPVPGLVDEAIRRATAPPSP